MHWLWSQKIMACQSSCLELAHIQYHITLKVLRRHYSCTAGQLRAPLMSDLTSVSLYRVRGLLVWHLYTQTSPTFVFSNFITPVIVRICIIVTFTVLDISLWTALTNGEKNKTKTLHKRSGEKAVHCLTVLMGSIGTVSLFSVTLPCQNLGSV